MSSSFPPNQTGDFWVGQLHWDGTAHAVLVLLEDNLMAGQSVRGQGITLQPSTKLQHPSTVSLSIEVDNDGSVSAFCAGPRLPTSSSPWQGSWDFHNQFLWADTLDSREQDGLSVPMGHLSLTLLRAKQASDSALLPAATLAQVLPEQPLTAWHGFLTTKAPAETPTAEVSSDELAIVRGVECSLEHALFQLPMVPGAPPVWFCAWFGDVIRVGSVSDVRVAAAVEQEHTYLFGMVPLSIADVNGQFHLLNPEQSEDSLVWGAFQLDEIQMSGYLLVEAAAVHRMSLVASPEDSLISLQVKPGRWESSPPPPDGTIAAASTELTRLGLPSSCDLRRALSQQLIADERSRPLDAAPRTFADSACPIIPVIMRESERRKLASEIWETQKTEELLSEVSRAQLSASDRAQLENTRFLRKCPKHHSVSVFTLPLWIICPPELRSIVADSLGSGGATYPYYQPSQLSFSLPRRKCTSWSVQSVGPRGVPESSSPETGGGSGSLQPQQQPQQQQQQQQQWIDDQPPSHQQRQRQRHRQ